MKVGVTPIARKLSLRDRYFGEVDCLRDLVARSLDRTRTERFSGRLNRGVMNLVISGIILGVSTLLLGLLA